MKRCAKTYVNDNITFGHELYLIRRMREETDTAEKQSEILISYDKNHDPSSDIPPDTIKLIICTDDLKMLKLLEYFKYSIEDV